MELIIVYTQADLIKFRIPEIVEYLEHKSEIDRIYYWDRDNNSTQTIVDYMEQSILKSDIVIVISSKFSSKSGPVKMEIDFAIINGKRIIPVFKNFKFVKDFIKIYRGLQFEDDFQKFLANLFSVIIGNQKKKKLSK